MNSHDKNLAHPIESIIFLHQEIIKKLFALWQVLKNIKPDEQHPMTHCVIIYLTKINPILKNPWVTNLS